MDRMVIVTGKSCGLDEQKDEIKCPKCFKCGSEMIKTNLKDVDLNGVNKVDLPVWLCACGEWCTIAGMEEHRDRLDKVLIDFVDRFHGKFVYLNKGQDFLGYNKNVAQDKPFYIIKLKEWISLDTAESLLKDINVEKKT